MFCWYVLEYDYLPMTGHQGKKIQRKLAPLARTLLYHARWPAQSDTRKYRTTYHTQVAYDTAVAVSQVASEASGQRPQRDDRLGFLVGGSLSGQIIHYCSNTGVISSPRDVEEVGRDTR